MNVTNVLFLLYLVIHDRSNHGLMDFFTYPPICLFLVRRNDSKLLFRNHVFFLRLVHPRLYHFNRLPKTKGLILYILNPNFNLINAIFFL